MKRILIVVALIFVLFSIWLFAPFNSMTMRNISEIEISRSMTSHEPILLTREDWYKDLRVNYSVTSTMIPTSFLSYTKEDEILGNRWRLSFLDNSHRLDSVEIDSVTIIIDGQVYDTIDVEKDADYKSLQSPIYFNSIDDKANTPIRNTEYFRFPLPQTPVNRFDLKLTGTLITPNGDKTPFSYSAKSEVFEITRRWSIADTLIP